MQKAKNKILITGGASGIGSGMTEAFIGENYPVIICGRQENLLKETVKKVPSVITKVCDVSDEAECIELYNWISENHSDLNVLINNAGIMNRTNITDEEFYDDISKAHGEKENNLRRAVKLY